MPMDPVWSTKCFLDSSCIKNGFYIFDWLKKIKRIFHDTWKLCKIKISVSINKALLKHSHTHSFMILFWLLSCFKGRVEYLWQSLDGPLWVNYFLSSPFIEKVYWPLVLKKMYIKMYVYILPFQVPWTSNSYFPSLWSCIP